MTRLSTSRIEECLRSGSSGKPMADAGEFWSDFKARARLRNQEECVEARTALPAYRAWALAAACAVLVIASAAVFLRGGLETPQLSRATALDVESAYGGVLIMNDEPSQSTILWVVDMVDVDEEGDNA